MAPRLIKDRWASKYFFSLVIIYIYRIFLGGTMYELYLFMQAVRPIAHYVFFFSCGRKDPPRSGLMVSVNVTWWS